MTVDSAQEPSSVEEFKIAGNEAYKNSDYQVAEDYYSKALSLNPELREKSILYKNRAMARLKLENFEGAESDCSSGKINLLFFVFKVINKIFSARNISI